MRELDEIVLNRLVQAVLTGRRWKWMMIKMTGS